MKIILFMEEFFHPVEDGSISMWLFQGLCNGDHSSSGRDQQFCRSRPKLSRSLEDHCFRFKLTYLFPN